MRRNQSIGLRGCVIMRTRGLLLIGIEIYAAQPYYLVLVVMACVDHSLAT